MFRFSLALFLSINYFFIISLGKLDQLNNTTIFCPDDEVVFLCQIFSTNEVEWNVRTSNGYFYGVSFGSGHNNVGDVRAKYLGYSTIMTEVTFINSSTIISTLKLSNITHLNGTIVTCNEEITTLFIDSIGRDNLPNQVLLSQTGLNFNYSISLIFAGSANNRIVDRYRIGIAPTEGHEVNSIFNDVATFQLYKENESYNLTLFTLFCNGLELQQEFIVGRCPFLRIPEVTILYRVWFNGSQTGLIRYANGKELLLHCEINGEWTKSTENNQHVEHLEPPIDNFTTCSCTEEDENTYSNYKNVDECSSVIVGVSGGSLGLSFLVGILSFLLGLKCRVPVKKSQVSLSSNNVQIPDNAIYEEINQSNAANQFDLTSNAAYGDLTCNAAYNEVRL